MSHVGGGAATNFRVAVRVRPLNAREASARSPTCVLLESEKTLTINNLNAGERPISSSTPTEHRFVYDRVFGPSASQSDLYATAVRPIVSSVLQGYNGSVIAYGQTGTGKTFTIEGALEGEQRGVIPRAVQDIFTHIQYLVRVSYLQIYNEKISDLLQPSSDANLRIRERGNGEPYGLSEHVARRAEDVYKLLAAGKNQRVTNSTSMNRVSSRSHAVFTIVVEHSSQRAGKAGGNVVTIGKLHLVDLAGSERFEASSNEKHQKETANINTSLSTFGKVVLSLTSKHHRHAPYRDSKLTRILQNTLGGNCMTTMITTVTLAAINYLESLASLKFASRAQHVKNHAILNEDKDEQALLSSYKTEIERLKAQLAKAERVQREKEELAAKIAEMEV
ncbi:uncharacterized protein MONBRDRAFT_25905 [Monosiga brevicollis MX1]|uniref:Kinesin-like protein n=1 Tax=Monosiga brevicollis TaxID=81824 RepID=A9V0T6_MONBE|nr:uncharacterized protein MONBRDRAFT_25905 [Monosiga brevicollis MX1]EDQ88811.1 predicted protein [Monosiga brevicollis MX1]|eukprot:XP_001746424.1 hypothetical protein [Monosiga brevicollis MX1]